MTTFPLEDEKFNYDTTEVSVVRSSSIKMVPFVIGIFIVLLGLLDMIILFAVPYHRITVNKKKLPDAHFKKPNAGVITVHFLLHVLIILIGVFVILFSFEDVDGIDHSRVRCGLMAVCIITAFMWVIQIAVDFTLTATVKSKVTIEQLTTIISRSPPIDFAFIYSEDTVTRYQCNDLSSNQCQDETVKCYSKTGVTIPIKSSINSPIYDFKDTPKMFYFTYEQDLNMSTVFSAQFNGIMNNIKNCDPKSKKVTEYYPLVAGTYIVSMDKIPTYLKKATRITSIIFGVGIYYELSSKSVPYITYKQNIIAESADNVNYNSIFTSSNCENFGKCSEFNKQPKPY